MYLARKKGSTERYALKSINTEDAYKKGSLDRLKNEVDIMMRVKGSDHLLQMHECFEENNILYLVLEYLSSVGFG